jgi:chromosomal replication initiation ATPase DnaA
MINLEYLINYVNNIFEVDIKINSRKRELVEARAFYYELARRLTTHTFQKIGDPLEKHHATVMYSLFLDKNMIEKSINDLSYNKLVGVKEFNELKERLIYLELKLENYARYSNV